MKVWNNPTLEDWREIVSLMCGEDSEALASACHQAHMDEETVAVDEHGTLLFDWTSEIGPFGVRQRFSPDSA